MVFIVSFMCSAVLLNDVKIESNWHLFSRYSADTLHSSSNLYSTKLPPDMGQGYVATVCGSLASSKSRRWAVVEKVSRI